MDLLLKIQSLLAQVENSALEFKSAQVHPDSLIREIVAFANSQGGTILFGVDDGGQTFIENIKEKLGVKASGKKTVEKEDNFILNGPEHAYRVELVAKMDGLSTENM